jgi:hypothetical protein
VASRALFQDLAPENARSSQVMDERKPPQSAPARPAAQPAPPRTSTTTPPALPPPGEGKSIQKNDKSAVVTFIDHPPRR